MISTLLEFSQRICSISSWYNNYNNKNNRNKNLINKLNIPNHTKQFVYTIQDQQTNSTIYILYVHGLSERSASDTEYLIKAVRPDAVISDWSWARARANAAVHVDDFGDGPNEPMPMSVVSVLKRCFMYKRNNKRRYQNVGINCLLQEIFGVGFETHHFVANRVSEEIGATFLMGSPRFFGIKDNNPVDDFAGSVKKWVSDVENGGNNVDSRELRGVDRVRDCVEARRLRDYGEGLRRVVNGSGGRSVGRFGELSREERSQYVAAKGVCEQAKKFRKIVVITGQDDWTGIEKYWNFPTFQETEDMTKKLYVSRVESPSFSKKAFNEKRQLSLLVGETSILVASVLFRKRLGHVFRFIRQEKRAIIPWFAFAGFANISLYGDAIASIPAASSIARLGRGIQSLRRAIRDRDGTQVNEP